MQCRVVQSGEAFIVQKRRFFIVPLGTWRMVFSSTDRAQINLVMIGATG